MLVFYLTKTISMCILLSLCPKQTFQVLFCSWQLGRPNGRAARRAERHGINNTVSLASQGILKGEVALYH
jgi:hypothetical protein